jgi:nitroimidazol reductase NimA-like FMN-containing flavoprotein (pyridoxamine 5'-phosphate oxidase superfamily)
MSAELTGEIIDYVNGHDRCVLATVKGEVPRATSVLYANEGMTLYVHTVRGMAKVYNIEANPNVALVIDDQAREGWRTMKSLQYIGRGEVLTDPVEQERIVKLYVGCFPMVKNMLTMAGLAKDQVLLKITPARLYFSDYTKGMGHRDKVTL